MIRIRGLAKLIRLLKDVCVAIAVFGPIIRNYVPSERLDDYDNALTSITAACDVIRSIEYNDNTELTNAPWG